MQHDHILKTKMNFGLRPNPLVYTDAFVLKSRLICFISIVPLSACEILLKISTTDLVIAKFNS